MAEERTKRPKKEGEGGGGMEFGPIQFGIGVIVLFLIFSSIFRNIESRTKSAPSGGLLSDTVSLLRGAKNSTIGAGKVSTERVLQIGDSITQTHPSILYDIPGGEALRGVAAGLRGVIIDGPLEYLSNVWWKIKYEDGMEGWVTETSILAEGEETLVDIAQNPEGPISTFYHYFVIISSAVSFLLLVGILYSSIRLFQIRREEEERLHGKHHETAEAVHEGDYQTVGEKPGKSQWEVVERHAASASESDWRLAILEADILLDDILRARGFVGESLGERLKNADRSDFQTLDKAWDAHKLRNTIAHEGINFPLSERETRRIIALYAEVLREFGFI